MTLAPGWLAPPIDQLGGMAGMAGMVSTMDATKFNKIASTANPQLVAARRYCVLVVRGTVSESAAWPDLEPGRADNKGSRTWIQWPVDPGAQTASVRPCGLGEMFVQNADVESVELASMFRIAKHDPGPNFGQLRCVWRPGRQARN